MARRYGLRDEQWERIKDLLPGREGHVGVTATDNEYVMIDSPISAASWLRIAAVAAVVFVVVEIEKWIRYGRGDHVLPE